MFDVRIGLAGGIFMGLIVFLINDHSTGNLSGSLTAAFKQGLFTFFFGGFIMKLSERIALSLNPKAPAILLSCLVPSLLSLLLTFGLHNLKGTPRPVESTIPTAFLVIPSTLVWGWMKRSKQEKGTK